MKIAVNQVKGKTENIKVNRYAKAGAKGGKAKVAKGFAKMDSERLKKIAVQAANKRWIDFRRKK